MFLFFKKLTEEQQSEMTDLVPMLLQGLYYDSCMAFVLGLNSSIGELPTENKSLTDFKISDFEIAKVIHRNVIKADFIGASVSESIAWT